MKLSEARVIADKYLEQLALECDLDLAFNADITEEHELGFVFFYNTKEYWNTKNFLHSLAGNGPILVRKDNGQVVVLPSNQSVIRSLSQINQINT